MNFLEAYEQMKKNKKARRKVDKKYVRWMSIINDRVKMRGGYFDSIFASSVLVEDLDATDWEIVE